MSSREVRGRAYRASVRAEAAHMRMFKGLGPAGLARLAVGSVVVTKRENNTAPAEVWLKTPRGWVSSRHTRPYTDHQVASGGVVMAWEHKGEGA